MKIEFKAWILLALLEHVLIPGYCIPHGRRHKAKEELKKCTESLREMQQRLASYTDTVLASEGMMADETGDTRYDPPFNLLLNEVNIDNPGPNKGVFIEFEVITRAFPRRSGKSDLEGFLFIIVRGDPLEVVISIDIGATVTQVTKNYLVVGTKEMSSVDISLDSEQVASVYSSEQSMPDFDDSPYALMVLHSQLESFNGEISLEKDNGHYQPLRLDERRKEIIRDHLVDMVVVARKAPKNFCGFFESLKPATLVDPNYKVMLRDWDGPTTQYTRDFSLSRCCGDKRPNDQDCWRLSTPSAGSENRCEYRRPFYLERIINRVGLEDEEDDTIETNDGSCQADYPGVPASRYSKIDDHTYAKALDDEVKSMTQCAGRQNMPVVDVFEEEQMEVDPMVAPVVVPLPRFDPALFEKCKTHIANYKLVNVPSITTWLEILWEGGQCKFRCYKCSYFLGKGFWPKIKNPSQVMTTGYFSPTNPTRNKNAILDHVDPKNHESYNLHQAASEYVLALHRAHTQGEAIAAEVKVHSDQKKMYIRDLRAMKLAWAELTAEISFRSHPIFHSTVTELGVDLGKAHANYYSLRYYAKAFSEGFHQRLIKHLTKQQQPFSFMADATTSRNTGFLVCLIQTLEAGQPVLYFWRLVRLTKSESGADMMEDIKRSIDEDDLTNPGFKSFFKEKLVAFISDRGSPMVGRYRGLIAQLRSYVSHEVQSVPCGAHVTETAIKHALDVPTSTPKNKKEKPEKYYMKFGDLNNRFYTYFMSRGSKRWSHLEEIAEELGIKPERIKYHHTIRWSKSKRVAMSALLKDFDAIRIDLERASKEKSDTSEKAKALLLIISDKSFGSTLAEFVDMLGVSEALLNVLQTKQGIIMGLSKSLRESIRKFESLKISPGKNLKAYLSRMTCPDVCSGGQCTLIQYDNCPLIQFTHSVVQHEMTEVQDTDSLEDDDSGASDSEEDEPESQPPNILTLEKKDPKSVPLSEWREVLYNRLIGEIKKLFDVRKIESFDAFDPQWFKFACPGGSGRPVCEALDGCYEQFLPIHATDVPEAATSKINRVCAFYSISSRECGVVISEWKNLLGQLIVSQKYEDLKQRQSPTLFWNVALHDSKLTWPTTIRKLIEKILVTGQSSAAAERAFSTLTRLRGSDRSSLAPDTLDDLIRIRFNGPDRIDNESLYEYLLIFLRDHRTVDHKQGGNPGRGAKTDESASTDNPSSFKRSRIFSSLP